MPDSADDTLALLQRWHSGESAALDRLLSTHLPLLHTYVRKRLERDWPVLRRTQDSLDLVQSAAARVLRYQPSFMPRDGGQFQALLRKLVVNEVLNQLRSPAAQKRESMHDAFGSTRLDLGGSSNSATHPSQAAQKSEERAWARLALEFLEDPDDRTLVLLAAVDEAPWAVIGEQIGMSPDAARVRYRRLLPRMANHLRRLREGRVSELLRAELDPALP